MIGDYLFRGPIGGEYQTWLITGAMICVIGWIITIPIGRRSGFTAIQRRIRRLGRILWLTALLITVSLLARWGEVAVVSWRIWLLLGFLSTGAALTWWLLGLRDVTHDKVEERHRHRAQFYGKPHRPGKHRRVTRSPRHHR